MIGCYNYTVILTYIGTVCGFVGVTYVGKGDLKMALVCLMLAGFCDMFDGKIASTMKSRTQQEKRFGIQIDSLSDFACFGVLPSLLVLKATDGRIECVVIAAVYLLCALIRLAWFNVDEEERQDREDKGREQYLGLPVTTSAVIFPMLMGICKLAELPINMIMQWVLLAVAIAFITPFRMRKPGMPGKMVMLLVGVGAFVLVMLGWNV